MKAEASKVGQRDSSECSESSVEVASSEGESASGEALPEGWASSPLKELATAEGVFDDGDWVESKDQDPNGAVRLIQLSDVGDGWFRDRSERFLTPEKAKELNCTFLEAGDLLISRLADPLGRACQFPGLDRDCVTVVDVAILRSGKGGVDHTWLMNFINSPEFRDEIESLSSGTTRKRISRKNLGSIEMLVPPKAEQSRIVSAIESLQERSSRARVLLSEVGPLIGQLRQSVLRGAFSGRLTAAWREQRARERQGPDDENRRPESETADHCADATTGERLGASRRSDSATPSGPATNPRRAPCGSQDEPYETAHELLQRIRTERRERWEAEQLAKYEAKGKKPPKNWQDKYKEPEPVDESELPELPEGWCWASLEELIVDGPTNGYSPKTNPNANGTPALKLSATTQRRLVLNEDTIKRLEEIIDPESKYWLRQNDVLIQRSNSLEYVGSTALYDGPDETYIYPDIIIRVRTCAEVDPQLLCHFLNSPQGCKFYRDNATGTAGNMPKINGTTVKRTPVPLPPIEEQAEIRRVAEAALQACMELESGLASMESSLTQMDQSILSKAFRGELVPQDPRDEPASELLARIRTNRGETKAARNTAKKTPEKKTTRKKRHV